MAVPRATLSIPELLAAGLQLVPRAGEIIREVAASGELHARDKAADTGGAPLPSVPANDTRTGTMVDPQTVADRRAQHLLVTGLRAAFPELKIVAEEEGALLAPDDPVVEMKVDKQHPWIDAQKFPPELLAVPVEDVCVWIDPLDGTWEFTCGVYDAVTTLYGISVKNVPVAGVIGCPFWPPSEGQEHVVVWGCVGVGVFGLPPPPTDYVRAQSADDEMVLCVTASRMTESLKADIAKLPVRKLITVGGSGFKILKVLSGECDAYLMNRAGCYRWDTCAGEALLRAVGGELTDCRGATYSYTLGDRSSYANSNGVIASGVPAIGQNIVRLLGK